MRGVANHRLRDIDSPNFISLLRESRRHVARAATEVQHLRARWNGALQHLECKPVARDHVLSVQGSRLDVGEVGRPLSYPLTKMALHQLLRVRHLLFQWWVLHER